MPRTLWTSKGQEDILIWVSLQTRIKRKKNNERSNNDYSLRNQLFVYTNAVTKSYFAGRAHKGKRTWGLGKLYFGLRHRVAAILVESEDKDVILPWALVTS